MLKSHFLTHFVCAIFKHLQYSHKVTLQCYYFGRNFQMTRKGQWFMWAFKISDSAGLWTKYCFESAVYIPGLEPCTDCVA